MGQDDAALVAGKPLPWDGKGRFKRADASFRAQLGDDAFPVAPHRYHLILASACPWCHRVTIVRALKGLQDVIGVSWVHPLMGSEGWHFDPQTHPDALYGWSLARRFYETADAAYDGRITVPILWDIETRTIVNNESSEIIRMLTHDFDAWSSDPGLDLYPEPLRDEIDALNERVYHTVNNGVYKCGFAKTQEAYQEAFEALFDSLHWLEDRLEGREWLVGDHMTEADWRLFVTLIRFDAVYVTHFKCNLKRIADLPNLQAFTRRLYRWPGIAEATNIEEIKLHYFGSHLSLNPRGIVPVGPELDL